MVGTEGIEPSTSILSEWRSTIELCAQNFKTGQNNVLVLKPPFKLNPSNL